MTLPTYYSASLAILIVDDDPVMLRMLEAMLRADRHVVGLAENTEAALEQFETRKWDLVLTDLNMPGANGEALAKEVKKRSPLTPVVLMTGFTGSPDYEGVEAIVRKPFRRGDIALAINRCLRGGEEGAPPLA